MEWPDVVKKHKSMVAKLEKEIKGYGYGDENQTISTDGQLCAWLVAQLRQAKKRLFNIIETLYGLHLESRLDKLAEELRDAVDVFSDEIKARHLRCRPSPLLEELVRHDDQIIEGIKFLNTELEKLYDRMMAGLKQPYDGRRDQEMWQAIKTQLLALRDQLEDVVRLFKERDAICNIKPLSLQKTYEMMRKRFELFR